MIAIRSCVACRKKAQKEKLLRIVADENKVAQIDKNQKINRRAIYICENEICRDNFIKMLKKNRVKLKVDIDNDSLITLLESLKY